jgi:hypothetical protein
MRREGWDLAGFGWWSIHSLRNLEGMKFAFAGGESRNSPELIWTILD